MNWHYRIYGSGIDFCRCVGGRLVARQHAARVLRALRKNEGPGRVFFVEIILR